MNEEELLDTLELFHFIVSVIGEDLNFLDIFKSGLAKVLRPRVARYLSETSEPITEANFMNSGVYQHLMMSISGQLHSLIREIRQAKLWLPQGHGGIFGKEVEQIEMVLKCESCGVEELRILRSISADKLAFMPEIALYYKALFRATMSDEHFTRAFAYAMIRDAPSIIEPQHLFSILEGANAIWSSSTVTFEFVAALAQFLDSVCEMVGGLLDDDLQEAIYKQIETIPLSRNFSMMMSLDPSLKWITKTLPEESFRRLLEKSLDCLASGCEAHMCLICRAVAKGLLDVGVLIEAVRIAIPELRNWSPATKKETRKLLASMVLRLPLAIVDQILTLIADSMKREHEHIIYVFAEFVIVHYLKTTAPFHEGFYNALTDMVAHRVESTDFTRMFAAVCANPLRFLKAVQMSKDRGVFDVIKEYHMVHTSLYHVLMNKSESPLLTDNVAGELVDKFIAGSLLEEIDEMDLSFVYLNVGCLASIYPPSINKLLDHIETSHDEEIKSKTYQIIATVTLTGRFPSWVASIQPRLPSITYVCEYTESLNTITESLSTRNILFDSLKSKLKCPEIVEFGSKLLTELAFVFQVVICDADSRVHVAFNRIRLSSPHWFLFTVSSLFTTMWEDPEPTMSAVIEKYVSKSPVYMVWFAVSFVRKIVNGWLDALADEKFDDLYQLVLCPRIKGAFGAPDFDEVEKLHEKYSDMFSVVDAVITPVFVNK